MRERESGAAACIPGWLDAEWRQTANSRRARYYRLTRAGRKQLDAQTADWTRRAGAIARILKAEG